jgi:hypothetical protein
MKKVLTVTVTSIVAITVSLMGFGAYKSAAGSSSFEEAGRILLGGEQEEKTIEFAEGEDYLVTRGGSVKLSGGKGERSDFPSESFIRYEGGGVTSLTGGVLLDFNDLSGNFINNYYISPGLAITREGREYKARTAGGEMSFGENLWKLSERKYLIQSPTLVVRFSGEDERSAAEYVMVNITEDGLVRLMTQENLWTTISPETQIETAGGVLINPVTQTVDDGRNKLSLAKLAVNADDPIVLTKDETRRQIVPELNISAVDGNDGETGETGEAGRGGEPGEVGDAGTTGVSGTAGEEGEAGEEGIGGDTGESGKKGAAGAQGSGGAQGSTGSPGGDGAQGNNGGRGAQGQSVIGSSSTNSVLPNITMAEWEVTATDLKGALKIDTETTDFFTALVTYMDDNGYSPEKYAARISVTDQETGKVYYCYQTDENYGMDTGWEADRDFDSDDEGGGGNFCITFAEDADGIVYFRLNPNITLTPDSRYTLSVQAYYNANNTIFTREFINRAFYTDSAGAFLSPADAGLNAATKEASLRILARIGSDYRASAQTADVYLLTPEENAGFSVAAAQGGKYEYHFAINYTGEGSVTGDSQSERSLSGTWGDTTGENIYDLSLEVEGLAPNSRYIARVILGSAGSAGVTSTLTKQSLSVLTLKLPPSKKDASQNPTANYNRVTGAIDVSRPAVTDPHGAVTEYVYTAYKGNDTGLESPVVSRTVAAAGDASAPASVSFFLGADLFGETEYVFTVDMRYDDNEKTVTESLGKSNSVTAKGDSMPKMILEKDDLSTYNKFVGKIIIDLAEASNITLGSGKNLNLRIYADQVYDEQNNITIEEEDVSVIGKTSDNANTLYKATASKPAGPLSNDVVISLELDLLRQNTQYTISVSGWLNVGDDNNEILREIGSVSFRTTETGMITMQWTPPSGNTIIASIAMGVQLSPQIPDAYTEEEIKNGSVTVELYTGTGAGRRLMGSKTYTKYDPARESEGSAGANALEQFFGKTANANTGILGYAVTEHDFGSPNLSGDADYTIVVSAVTDRTHDIGELNYVNYFERQNPTRVLQAQARPPDLMQNAHGGVVATPILNKDAVLYGSTVEKTMPDDMTIGYRLQSTFENETRLGVRVTYYAMEYMDFYNTLMSGKDPLNLDNSSNQVGMTGANILMQMTQGFDNSGDRAPPVAVLFGGTKSATGDDHNASDAVGGAGEATWSNGMAVYRAGAATGTVSLASGMERGYRYVFAYTVDYSTGDSGGATDMYPYASLQYEQFRAQVGAGLQYGNSLGRGTVYMLNSGLCEAPRAAPDFHSYVYDTEDMTINGSDSGGALIIDFKYRDTEADAGHTGTISTGGGTITNIYYNDGGVTQSIPLTGAANSPEYISGSSGWYRVKIPYSVTRTQNALVEPYVDAADYGLDYGDFMRELTYGTQYAEEDNKFYLCRVPVEYAWGKRFGDTGNTASSYQTGAVMLSQDMGYLSENYILYRLESGSGQADAVEELAGRAMLLKLEYELGDGTGVSWVSRNVKKTVYAPLSRENDGSYTAKVTAGTLGTEFLGGSGDSGIFHVVGTAVFDGGRQGWGRLDETGAIFALQNINRNANDFGFAGWRVGSITRDTPSEGAMQKTGGITTASLREAVKDAYRDVNGNKLDAKQQANFRYLTEQTSQLYLYPARYGVDTDNYGSIESMSGIHSVPKAAETYGLMFVTESRWPGDAEGLTGQGKITSMTPTIKLLADFTRGQTMVRVGDFAVTGADQTDEPAAGQPYAVGVSVYANRYNAEYLTGAVAAETTMYLGNAVSGVRHPQTNASYDPSGPWTSDPEASASDLYGALIDGLAANVNYYMVFHMKTGGEKVPLINADTAEKAVYTFTTSDKVTFSSVQGIVYTNNSYFEKTLSLTFNLGRYFGVRLRYDIFKDTEDPTDWTPESPGLLAPVLSDEELRAAGGILSAPTALTTQNRLTMDLKPSALRKALAPGGGYKLKISASENGQEAGSGIFGFRINPSGNNGALTYIADATKDFIDFQVTLTDPQYSFMGQTDAAGLQTAAGALYAVRFTYTDKEDGKEKRLWTVYDGEIFSGNTPKRLFRLNNDALLDDPRNPALEPPPPSSEGSRMRADTEYTLHVFAVFDTNHDGRSDSATDPNDAGSSKEWNYFFTSELDYSSNDGDASCGEVFQNLIDGFWKGTGEWDEDKENVRIGFGAARKSQKTTDDDGFVINEKQTAITRQSQTQLQLVLAESFGIVDAEDNDRQTFARIDWSLDGYTNAGRSVSESGSSHAAADPPNRPTADAMFVKGVDQAGYDIYRYDIPTEITAGSYSIVIELWTGDTDNPGDLYKSLSFTFRG